MAKRFVGQATLIESNKASQGQVSGCQIGGILPGVLESLQESASAAATSALYYEEALGSFLAPSFQRNYGIKDETIDNIQQWGDRGSFSVNNDIFWNGPAAITVKVQLKPRWRGNVTCGAVSVTPHFIYPSFFYSWGAGYAFTKEIRLNMGGAGQYTLNRYSNFIGVFASCFSLMQRYTLMKLAGGGVIADTEGSEGMFGLHFNTTKYGAVPNRWFEGIQAGSGQGNWFARETIIPENVRVPIEDTWVVAIKTPHTNYQNPRIRRRPLDTKLFSEHFTVDLLTSNFDEICDSGTNVPPVVMSAGAVDDLLGRLPIVRLGGGENEMGTRGTILDAENFRQYAYHYPYDLNVAPYVQNDVTYEHFNGADSTTFKTRNAVGDVRFFLPNTEDTANIIGPVLSPSNLPEIKLSTLVSSMRLTNDMLGAYDVLKTRTDQAVYYPFQYFTTQIYSVENTLYKDMSLDEYVRCTHPNLLINDETLITPIKLAVSIPVNPMTAMYIGVMREKDRKGLGISTPGGYSPCLFWNFLELPFLELSYGVEPLIRYDCTNTYISEQTYEHCSALQIPYKGGHCLQSEIRSQHDRDRTTTCGIFNPAPTNSPGMYHGVLRNAWVYELSLVEMEPLRNEAFFQQTPSFQGEQLNVSFRILPSTLSACSKTYNPFHDKSFIDNYVNTGTKVQLQGQNRVTYSTGVVEHVFPLTTYTDLTGSYHSTVEEFPGLSNEVKGGRPGDKVVDVWHMNNDPNLMVVVVYAQNALWQLNPNMSKIVFARG